MNMQIFLFIYFSLYARYYITIWAIDAIPASRFQEVFNCKIYTISRGFRRWNLHIFMKLHRNLVHSNASHHGIWHEPTYYPTLSFAPAAHYHRTYINAVVGVWSETAAQTAAAFQLFNLSTSQPAPPNLSTCLTAAQTVAQGAAQCAAMVLQTW